MSGSGSDRRGRPSRPGFDRETIGEFTPLLSRIASVAALVVAIVAVVLVVSRGSGTYEVTAQFDEVRGLIAGGAVKAGAIEVGTVEDVRLGEGGLPVVRMRIDDDFQLRRGSKADIRLTSNVGGVNRYIELSEGSGPPLGDGARLGPSETDQPVDLDVAVSELTPEVRADLKSILSAVDRTLDERGRDLDATLLHSASAMGETADLLGEVANDRVALQTIVREGRRVVGELAAQRADVGESAERLAAVLRRTAGRADELRRTVQALGPGLRQARRGVDRLGEATPNLRALVADLKPAMVELLPTARAIGPAIDALRPMLREAQKLIDATPRQLKALRPVLRKAVPVLEELDPVLEGLGPLLDHLRVKAPEVSSFFALNADATSNYDANGNLVRSTFVPIQGVRHPNVIGPSDTGPGLLRRPFDRTPGSLEGEPWEDYADSFIGGGKAVEEYVSEEEREGP